MGISYKDSGVDIEKGNSFVKKIAPIVKSTFNEKVITELGGFSALFSGSFPGMKEPVLVSGTDGVGTKLKIAQKINIHNTIGIDAVAMCVNDILTSGASPLFFLDYISCGKLNEDVLVEVVKGIADGCRTAGCSLIGGETAEHPNVMPQDDYDIAGFAVGVVDREKIITGQDIKKGDMIIGLPSSGIHSNGFSLVRKLFFEIKKYNLDQKFSDLNVPLGNALIEPTAIYCKPVLKCLQEGIKIKGLVHITGGGFYENIPRILPENTAVVINKDSYEMLPIFKIIQKEGEIEHREMYTTFNMGIGMMIFADGNDSDKIIDVLKSEKLNPAIIGEVIAKKDERVRIE